MNNNWIKYSLHFILIVLIQGLIVNNIEINSFLNPMVYPIMILMLPFELSVIATMFSAILLGVAIDAFSNTFGLHTSAALLIGYLRPLILRYIKPRDGYDSTLLPSIHDMGVVWFTGYATLFTFLHHLWFFSFEIMRFDLLFLIVGKTIFSSLFSIALIILFQFIFYKRTKK